MVSPPPLRRYRLRSPLNATQVVCSMDTAKGSYLENVNRRRPRTKNHFSESLPSEVRTERVNNSWSSIKLTHTIPPSGAVNGDYISPTVILYDTHSIIISRCSAIVI